MENNNFTISINKQDNKNFAMNPISNKVNYIAWKLSIFKSLSGDKISVGPPLIAAHAGAAATVKLLAFPCQ